MFNNLFMKNRRKNDSVSITAWLISSVDKHETAKELSKKFDGRVVSRAIDFAEEYGMYDGKYFALYLSRAGHYEGDRYVGPTFDIQWKPDVMRLK